MSMQAEHGQKPHEPKNHNPQRPTFRTHQRPETHAIKAHAVIVYMAGIARKSDGGRADSQ